MTFIKYPKFVRDFEGIWFSSQNVLEIFNINFNDVSTNGNRNVASR